jgi:hypothetical protein
LCSSLDSDLETWWVGHTRSNHLYMGYKKVDEWWWDMMSSEFLAYPQKNPQKNGHDRNPWTGSWIRHLEAWCLLVDS